MAEPQQASRSQTRWEVNQLNEIDGFTTSTLQEITIHNFGPSPVKIFIDGSQFADLAQETSDTYALPSGQVRVEVRLVPGTVGSVGEFRF